MNNNSTAVALALPPIQTGLRPQPICTSIQKGNLFEEVDARKLRVMLLGFESLAAQINPRLMNSPVAVSVEKTILCRVTGISMCDVMGLVIEVEGIL